MKSSLPQAQHNIRSYPKRHPNRKLYANCSPQSQLEIHVLYQTLLINRLILRKSSIAIIIGIQEPNPPYPSRHTRIILKEPRKGHEPSNEHGHHSSHQFGVIKEGPKEEPNRSSSKRYSNNNEIHGKKLTRSSRQPYHPIYDKHIEERYQKHVRYLYRISAQEILRKRVKP